jgi:drug/metabolite transporter (DMT)-like permease
MMIVGTLLGLLAAIFWASSNVAIQSSSRLFGSWGALIWAQLLGGPIVALAALAIHGPFDMLSPSSLALIALGGACALGGYGGLFKALSLGQVSVVIPIVVGWTVVSTLTSIVFLGQNPSMWVWAGIGLILASNALIAHASQKTDSPDSTPRSALLWAFLAACSFGLMMPIVSVLGTRTGTIWPIPLIWLAELLLLLPFRRPGQIPKGWQQWWIAGRVAIFESCGFSTFAFGISIAPVGVVAPLSSLGSAFSIALGLFLLREKVGSRVIAGALAASLGVVLVHF